MDVCSIKKHSCGSRHRNMELQPISDMVWRSAAHLCRPCTAAHTRDCSYVESAGKN